MSAVNNLLASGTAFSLAYLGCYLDHHPFYRTLPHAAGYGYHDNSPDTCAVRCDQDGFDFSGVENRLECFCGHEIPGEADRADSEGECNMVCPGDASAMCGAGNRLNVYWKAGEKAVFWYFLFSP